MCGVKWSRVASHTREGGCPLAAHACLPCELCVNWSVSRAAYNMYLCLFGCTACSSTCFTRRGASQVPLSLVCVSSCASHMQVTLDCHTLTWQFVGIVFTTLHAAPPLAIHRSCLLHMVLLNGLCCSPVGSVVVVGWHVLGLSLSPEP